MRAACEPASLLTAAMAALLLWRGDALLGLGSIVVRVANQDWTAAFRSTASLPAFLTHPLVVVGAALAIAPLLLWASWRLYRWSARVVSATVSGPPAPTGLRSAADDALLTRRDAPLW